MHDSNLVKPTPIIMICDNLDDNLDGNPANCDFNLTPKNSCPVFSVAGSGRTNQYGQVPRNGPRKGPNKIWRSVMKAANHHKLNGGKGNQPLEKPEEANTSNGMLGTYTAPERSVHREVINEGHVLDTSRKDQLCREDVRRALWSIYDDKAPGPDVKSVDLMMRGLRTFRKCSGLKANLDKSAMYFGNVPVDVQTQILDATGFTVGKTPFKYQ
uniref:Uncharacterized protein n=1 Tax=Chenopodium quinoa TaxID=63459 RepID=A0A803NEF1_CHEQI